MKGVLSLNTMQDAKADANPHAHSMGYPIEAKAAAKEKDRLERAGCGTK